MCSRDIRIAYTQPFDWQAMLAFFRTRAIEGLEQVDDLVYCRTVSLDEDFGLLSVRNDAVAGEMVADLQPGGPALREAIAERLRQCFDLDTDLAPVAQHFAKDPLLAPLVAARPAVRIPGHWEPFETAIRAVLGQQVTLAAARFLAARLVERAGARIGASEAGGPYRLFPTPQQILGADLSAMRMPGARVRTLLAVSSAFAADPNLFRRSATVEETVSRLGAIKGVGPWTAHYVALRACREPDAFPASDVGLLRGAARGGRRPSPAELLARAEAWRPFRAYAAHHIWAGLDGGTPAPSRLDRSPAVSEPSRVPAKTRP